MIELFIVIIMVSDMLQAPKELLQKKRNNDFKKYADAKAQNRTAVKKQKYIDKYSINDTTKGLNAKGKKKYSKLKKKASKLSDKYYNDIESDYQNNKHRYNIQIT